MERKEKENGFVPNITSMGYKELMETIQCFSPCMDDYLYVYDMDNDTYSISESAVKRFRIPSDTFHNVVDTHELFVYKEDLPKLQYDLDEMIAGIKDSHDLTYRWVGINGEPIWINCRGRVIRGENTLMIGCINEIGMKQDADNLTGLLSEKAFIDGIHILKEVPHGFILRIGIDDFKIINEQHGRNFADAVLRDVAECIKEHVNKSQLIFRMPADEFLVVDRNGGTVEEANELYRSIRRSIDERLAYHNYEAVYTVSAGVITHEYAVGDSEQEKTMDVEQINKRSQFALSQAKSRGKNQLYVYCQEEYDEFVRSRAIIQNVRKSIKEDFRGFQLYFQPIMEAGRESMLYAAEALLRYETQEGISIPPQELIPLLEESGLIIPVGNWIFNNAFRMCRECQQVLPEFKISVNLSYVQLLKSSIYKNIMAALQETGLSPESVMIEMTESGHLDYSAAQDVWRKLKRQGFHIAIDDFGTGYSNLHRIGQLQPNIIKIDKSFTNKALHNTYEKELMKYIVRMVHSIDVGLVIEGIETDEELEAVMKLHPDFIQGYYYSKPVSEVEFRKRFLT